MSSEQEESADHLDESNANSSVNVDQSLDQKGNGLKEHAKPRRRRRGKKRKHKKESAATCEAENPEECESELHVEKEPENHVDCDSPAWVSDENLSCDYNTYSDVIIRPINVPSAPLNSTQFIIDDHNDCHFYTSFETPNPYGVSSHTDPHLDGEEGDIYEPIGDDAAYIDIDYQYESPQDFDNTAYYDKEFELSYKNNRFEELMRFSRTELINRLQSLESRFKELNEDLVKENPSPMLEKLQTELLELQEKNSYLKDCNSKLTTVLQNESDCSETLTCQTITEGISISSISHDEHDSEDSDREVYEDSIEPAEVAMLDINSDSPKGICDKNSDSRIHCNETEDDQRSEVDDQQKDHNKIDFDPQDDCSEVDSGKKIDHIKVDSDQQNDCNDIDSDKLLSKELKSEECMSSSTTIINSEDIQTKHIHSNSHIIHCQPNNLVHDDLRTLNINTSELFHIANQTKCSSLVPLEGGMSPSETSVN